MIFLNSELWAEFGKLGLFVLGCLALDVALFMKTVGATDRIGNEHSKAKYLDFPWLGPLKAVLFGIALYSARFLVEEVRIFLPPVLGGLFFWTEMYRYRLISTRT